VGSTLVLVGVTRSRRHEHLLLQCDQQVGDVEGFAVMNARRHRPIQVDQHPIRPDNGDVLDAMVPTHEHESHRE
jgi:hypothetical protein